MTSYVHLGLSVSVCSFSIDICYKPELPESGAKIDHVCFRFESNDATVTFTFNFKSTELIIVCKMGSVMVMCLAIASIALASQHEVAPSFGTAVHVFWNSCICAGNV